MDEPEQETPRNAPVKWTRHRQAAFLEHLAFSSNVAASERAAKLTLGETAALVWHCLADRPAALDQDTFGEALVEAGLAALTPLVRTLLQQVLKGR